MTASKFASITASLLARKGEARPWSEPDQPRHAALPEPAFAAPLMLVADSGTEMPLRREAANDKPPQPAPGKRFSMRMTSHEYAQLGMLAARQGCTRQKFLEGILRRILEGSALEFAAYAWRADAEPRHKW
jgi:hypothetical protein